MAEEPREDPQNPFKGTPLEGLFGQMGGGQFDLGQMMSQMQRMFEPHEGTVNYRLAADVARHAVAAAGEDPTPHTGQIGAVADAARLAEMWLDRVTDLPAGATSAVAWSRAEWVEHTMDTWQVMVEPVAQHVVASMEDAIPPEAKAMAGPLVGMLNQAGGAMFGQQVGSAIGALATEVLSSTEVGLPLGPEHTAALLPHNITALAEGLEATQADVLLYVMLRESAHHRLYARATWLRAAVLGAIEDFARGIRIDVAAIEEQMRSVDPSNPQAMQEALSGGLFDPRPTPEQERAKERLELLLALVEGWVDSVVAQATADVMPAAGALAEAFRRRRATGGPAEETFATLVGLELRPRRLRDAANLWSALRDRRGAEARDTVWSHPDLLPTSADLDDPLGFCDKQTGELSDADFDAALQQLLSSDESSDDESGDESGADDAR
ncbi:zinc-dependent metalloprotease [Aeromicrobium duanguangcaii]|uniref:zinc-dependent metalloprotease n=1 Tax=Aeromicrobium duanguangcaii TaxID=2968086 RepID=UPI0020177C37|nr:zinc-dependent metalloprotease [Aeromicrobium duanguangcaii]MCL3838872.1 zinc-dependent metalloprotease [Aeromicrobium duanguangcaii]